MTHSVRPTSGQIAPSNYNAWLGQNQYQQQPMTFDGKNNNLMAQYVPQSSGYTAFSSYNPSAHQYQQQQQQQQLQSVRSDDRNNYYTAQSIPQNNVNLSYASYNSSHRQNQQQQGQIFQGKGGAKNVHNQQAPKKK